MLNKLGVLAFSLTAGCQVTGNPIPSTQHGSRVVEGFSGHLRCTPVRGSPLAHTQLTLISWVASGTHRTHVDFLGRLHLTANTQLHFQSVMPTLSCTQPAAEAAAYPTTPALWVLCEMLNNINCLCRVLCTWSCVAPYNCFCCLFRERETHTQQVTYLRFFIFWWTSFLPLFIRRVQGTKRTNQEQRLYTQRSVKTRSSIVRVVWMCVNGVLVWTWVTDYSVCLCECVLCACLNSVRFATNDFCLHKTGFKTWIYIASRMLRWCFDRQRASTLKSESS